MGKYIRTWYTRLFDRTHREGNKNEVVFSFPSIKKTLIARGRKGAPPPSSSSFAFNALDIYMQCFAAIFEKVSL